MPHVLGAIRPCSPSQIRTYTSTHSSELTHAFRVGVSCAPLYCVAVFIAHAYACRTKRWRVRIALTASRPRCRSVCSTTTNKGRMRRPLRRWRQPRRTCRRRIVTTTTRACNIGSGSDQQQRPAVVERSGSHGVGDPFSSHQPRRRHRTWFSARALLRGRQHRTWAAREVQGRLHQTAQSLFVPPRRHWRTQIGLGQLSSSTDPYDFRRLRPTRRAVRQWRTRSQ